MDALALLSSRLQFAFTASPTFRSPMIRGRRSLNTCGLSRLNTSSVPTLRRSSISQAPRAPTFAQCVRDSKTQSLAVILGHE
jgi:hypothetical protein